MHRTHLTEILSNAAIAHAIRPAVDRSKFTFAETRDALITLEVPRAAIIAALVASE